MHWVSSGKVHWAREDKPSKATGRVTMDLVCQAKSLEAKRSCGQFKKDTDVIR